MSLCVLVIGSGVYVSGRGTTGFGTVLPALFPLVSCGKIDKLIIAVKSEDSSRQIQEKIMGLNQFLKTMVRPLVINLKNINLEKIIDEHNVDLGYVCTPDDTHFELAQTLLSKNIHVQVVKPLSPKSADCRKLADLCQEKKLLASVEYHKRFDRSNKQLRNALLSGEVGDPLYFIVEYSQRKTVPLKHFKSWAHTTNPFQYLGVHYADIIFWALNHEAHAVRLSATGNKLFLKENGLNTYDHVNVTIEYLRNSKKFTGHFFINWIDPENTTAMSDQRIKVIGTHGRMECDQKDRGVNLVTDLKSSEHINPDFCRPYIKKAVNGESLWSYEGYGIESVASMVGDVWDYKNKKISYEDWSQTRATFRQSVAISKLVETVDMSLAKNGEWISL